MNNQPLPDVNGRQRRLELSENVMNSLIENAAKLGKIADEQSRHTDLLERHSQQFESLNTLIATEGKERTVSDKKEHRFAIWMAFLSFALGLLADHLMEIIEWAKSLYSAIFG